MPLEFNLEQLSRIDLEFERVRRDTGTFSVFVFAGKRRLPDDADRGHARFLAAFTVFGSEGCWGDEGHCDFDRGPVSAFDRRPEHHLSPTNITIDITDRAKIVPIADPFEFTIHAQRVDDPKATDVFQFERVTALVYQ